MTTKPRRAGITGDAADDLQARRDLLPNLELLEGAENISKSDSAPTVWASLVFTTPESLQAYLDRNAVPTLPADAHAFAGFYDERRATLARRIAQFLGASNGASEPTEAGLQETIDEGLAESSYNE